MQHLAGRACVDTPTIRDRARPRGPNMRPSRRDATTCCSLSAELVGPALVLAGAWSFAGANAVAKSLYDRGLPEITLFLIRSLVVYLMNASVLLLRRQPRLLQAAIFLTVGSRRIFMLLILRSCLGFAAVLLLNVTMHYFLTFADTFAIFLGVVTCGTVLGARCLLGSGEQLGWRETGGGFVTVCGIVLITQPAAIFGGAQVQGVGVFTACLGGALCSGFNVCSRVLVRSDGTYQLSPSLLLSYYMVTIGLLSLAIALGAALVCGDSRPSWTRLAFSSDARDFGLGASFLVLHPVLLKMMIHLASLTTTNATSNAPPMPSSFRLLPGHPLRATTECRRLRTYCRWEGM